MGLISRIPEVDRLRVAKLRIGRTVLVENAVMVERVLVLRLTGGRWWSSGTPDFNRFMYRRGWEPAGIRETLRGLVLLGILPEWALEAHQADCEQVRRQSELESDQETLECPGKKYGFEVPQIAKGASGG